MPEDYITIDTLANLKEFRRPDYPRADREAGRQGDVWIRVLVDSSGAVREALLFKSSGTRSLDDAALAAAPDSVFEPAFKDGEPTHTWVTYRVTFAPPESVDIKTF